MKRMSKDQWEANARRRDAAIRIAKARRKHGAKMLYKNDAMFGYQKHKGSTSEL